MKRIGLVPVAGSALALLATCLLVTDAPAQVSPGPHASARAGTVTAAEMEKLVAPIALYPDDLVAIVLPAATTPIDVIKGERFLQQRKGRPGLKPDPKLAEPVRNLLNYPDVIRKMADEIDWTQALGQAFASQPKEVMGAVQTFRRKVQAAGNLRTDDKQIVVVEREVIKIVQADPQVIYVPQYQPAAVVIAQPAPPVAYAPTPYPVYYYPYPAGAAVATGLVVGATTAFAVNWTHHGIWHGYDVEDLQRERIDYARESREDRQSHQRDSREDWQSHQRDQQAARHESAATRQSSGRSWQPETAPERQTTPAAGDRARGFENRGSASGQRPTPAGGGPFGGGGPRGRRP